MKKTIGLLIIATFWSLFAYVVGFRGWNDADFFSNGWWFDTFAHSIAGIAIALSHIYLFLTYSRTVSRFRSTNQFLFFMLVMSSVVFWLIIWESGELFWDAYMQPGYFPDIAKAQKYPMDTTIDLLNGMFFGFITMIGYIFYNKTYEKLYPNDYSKELIVEYARKIDDIIEEIAKHKKDHRRLFLRLILKKLKTAFKKAKK